jgi:hypothetical protein
MIRYLFGYILGYGVMGVGLALVAWALTGVIGEESRRRTEAEMACPCGSKACPGRATVVLPRGR